MNFVRRLSKSLSIRLRDASINCEPEVYLYHAGRLLFYRYASIRNESGDTVPTEPRVRTGNLEEVLEPFVPGFEIVDQLRPTRFWYISSLDNVPSEEFSGNFLFVLRYWIIFSCSVCEGFASKTIC